MTEPCALHSDITSAILDLAKAVSSQGEAASTSKTNIKEVNDKVNHIKELLDNHEICALSRDNQLEKLLAFTVETRERWTEVEKEVARVNDSLHETINERMAEL